MSTRIAMVGHVDHGKSTLIGRLLSDTGQTRSERTAKVQSLCDSTGRKFEYAFLLDALEEEQAQGITIDVTEVNWRFKDSEYVFVDTPGHREFLKKMVGGASRVEAAVLLVDVNEEIQDSFRRQMMVLDLLGVRRRVIAVNKMDLVDWNEQAWLKREREIRRLLQASDCESWIVPISAWHGANLLGTSKEMPWYSGESFAEALRAAAKPAEAAPAGPSRFFVQDVYRRGEKRIYVGRVESGEISVGDELAFHPGGSSSRVRGIEVYGEDRVNATAGEAVGLTLETPLYLDRGALGFKHAEAPLKAPILRGDLFWLDSRPIRKGDRLKIKMATRAALAVVEKIEFEIDGESFIEREAPESLKMFGRVHFRFEEEWAFDPFEECEPTGRFVVSHEGRVLGGGRWIGVGAESKVSASRLPGSVFWLSGLSGSGKTTIARYIENKFIMESRKIMVLDGDVLRQGLCADLGFSDEDRRENIRRAAYVAKMFADQGFTVLAAFISPREELRALAREVIGASRFKDVFIDCPLEICEARDVKGLYAKARRGELAGFTGLFSPFERPARPDLLLRTDAFGIEQTVNQLSQFMKEMQ